MSELLAGGFMWINNADKSLNISLAGIVSRVGTGSEHAADFAVSPQLAAYLINSTGSIFYNNIVTNIANLSHIAWTQVPFSGIAKAIAVDFNGNAYVVDALGNVWNGTHTGSWVQMSKGNTVGATAISVGLDGSVWVVIPNGSKKNPANVAGQYCASNDKFVPLK